MTRNNIIISLIAACCATLPSAAQVSKEITVEREVVATLRDVSPLTFNPTVALPPVAKPSLTYSERTVTARVPSIFFPLEPAAVADSIAASPWRGYASIGYFPAFNLGASAGYRIIDSRRSTLDAWLQYDGNSYNAECPLTIQHEAGVSHSVKDQNLALGTRLSTAVGRSGRLDLGLGYALAHFNNPFHDHAEPISVNQTVHRADINAMFTSKTNDLGYCVGLDYGLFSFARGFEMPRGEIRPVRENRAALSGALFADIDANSSFRLDLNASMLSRSRAGYLQYVESFPTPPIELVAERDGMTSGLITLTPSYRHATQRFVLNLGARVDLSINDGKALHIAPDIKATWMPSPVVALYGRAGGGEHQNTMGSLFAVDRLIGPVFYYSNSHVPIEAEAGLRIGPFRGAAVNLSAHYAVANDWLMPYAEEMGVVAFAHTDVRGWQFNALATYSYRDLATLHLSGTISPVADDKVTRCYYTNLDHARYILDTELTLHPLKPLDIMVGYELRACRSMRWSAEGLVFDYDVSFPVSHDYKLPLDNLANLRVGASWRFTPAFTAFLRLDNILNRTTESYSLIPGQGFKGLAGIAYKF